ncbi:hypothetical protein [Gordonia sp. N1V]|uniref:hypothetical protein n=1 Tax=Gordonia sp. N1V TaxID=3034163 RepID=UPI0023E2E06A|nr:hypothetical protein [Gordonia sp. N1V]MDF3280937.1 hypothetical protein [Gordonia sp. N1V]
MTLASGLGIVILLGGEQRFSTPSLHILDEYGHSIGWGLGFLALALLFMIASTTWPWLLSLAYRTAAVAYVMFAIGLVAAAATSPFASLTGIVVFLWIAWLHITAGTRAVAQKGSVWSTLHRFLPSRTD